MEKKNKNDKPVNINMGFEEAMQRLSNVPKSQVEANIKRHNKNKKNNE
ncbi:hypothetical protein [Allomuricauda sp. M10]|nr:hypothetical protein [Muricauda sp. M10]